MSFFDVLDCFPPEFEDQFWRNFPVRYTSFSSMAMTDINKSMEIFLLKYESEYDNIPCNQISNK